MLLDPVHQQINISRQAWADIQAQLPTGLGAVVSQLSMEAFQAMSDGDWDSAHKFMYYCNEIAKCYGHQMWHPTLLAIRRVRDLLAVSKPIKIGAKM